MANISSAYGTVVFSHPTANESLIEEVVRHTLDNWYYGQLVLEGFIGNPDEEFPWIEWNHEYEFESQGRWTFENSLSFFFENLPKELAEKCEGMQMRFEFIDHEPGMGMLVEQMVSIAAVKYPETGDIQTEVVLTSTDDMEYSAETLAIHAGAEDAIDTFTDYGIGGLIKELVYLSERNEAGDNKELEKLGEVLKETPEHIALLKEVFSDLGLDNIVVDFVLLDDIEMIFIDNKAYKHDKLKKLVRDNYVYDI